MAFPPFTDYQDTFSSPLPASMFATFTFPSWIPPPAQLLRLAKVIYPHWRERRIERGGHRIIPILNVGGSWLAHNNCSHSLSSMTKLTSTTSRISASAAAKSRLSGRRVHRKPRLQISFFAYNQSLHSHWSWRRPFLRAKI